MQPQFLQIPGIRVSVNNVMYVPNLNTTAEKPYAFVYFITVENESTEQIQILGRKWVVREADGECTVVEGEGVVGEKPEITPGDNFTYNSCHVIAHRAEAEGALFGRTSSGSLFCARIPQFLMELPEG
ncbi:ApaG domain-containing protein [Rubritalea sp.]|uniref:ApaG domain-containing protein n=1 Tax=Rubritalea sp. TaxID=2109375 RepID=UPI003EF6DD2B